MSDISEHSAQRNADPQQSDDVIEDPLEHARQQLQHDEEGEEEEEQSPSTPRNLKEVKQYSADNSVEFLDNTLADVLHSYRSHHTKGYLMTHVFEVLRFETLIKKYGLPHEHLSLLFGIIMTFKLGPTLAKRLINLLLPREKIPEKMIIQVIGKLSIKDVDLKTLNHMLIWSISVMDMADKIELLRSFYSVLFHFLRFNITRASSCHLLYYLTRKQNVTPYRVRKLTEMIESERDNAPLLGLLTAYQRYDSSISVPINVKLNPRSAYLFTQPNLEFVINLANIKVYWNNAMREDEAAPFKPEVQLSYPKKRGSPSNDRVERDGVGRKPSGKRKRRQAELLPSEVSFTALHNYDIATLVDQIQSLSVSEQLENVLDDRNLQHLLACYPHDLTIERLSYWIGIKMIELTRYNNSRDKGKEKFKELLQKLVTLTRFAKSQLPIIEDFLREYLKSWNGIAFEEEIFELITYIKPGDYDELYQNILLPLYRKYYVSDVVWKAKLIDCYTEWLKNWALLDWKGHTRRSMEQDAAAAEQTEDKDVDRLTTLFGALSFDVNYFTTIQKLVEHVDRISVMGFLSERDHPLLQHASLSFFELVATIPTQHDIPEIIIPAANFVHRSFFSSHAMAVSRICGIVCQYKKAFLENEKKEDDWVSRHSTEYLGHFNTYMKDMCSSLWRNMGLKANENTPDDALTFSLTRANIQTFTDICENRGDEVNRVLSITHSSALAGYSKRYMMLLQDEMNSRVKLNEPVTPESLKRLEEQGGLELDYSEYRVDYLDYLNNKGLTGIHDLLYACMTTLINLKMKREEEEEYLRSRASLNSQRNTRQSISTFTSS